jgi:ArsR family transcriptional regulator
MNDRKGKKSKEQAADKLYKVIHVLTDVNRMQILRLLADRGELCARDILSHFPITQPTLSHHMNVLLENQLIEARKSGRWVFYRLSGTGLQGVIDFFESLKNTVPASTEVHQISDAKTPDKKPPVTKAIRKPAQKAAVSENSAEPEKAPAVEAPDVSTTDSEAKKEKKKDKNKDKSGKKDKKKKKNKKR